MKFLSSFALLIGACKAFAPRQQLTSFGLSSSCSAKVTRTILNENKVPFFASVPSRKEEAPGSKSESSDASEDDEVEEMVREELRKTNKMSNLRNSQGVDYAPWMKITKEDEEKIRAIMREKAKARAARKEQERSVTGSLYADSQAQELSGTGLKSKIIDGDVELEWATKSETNCKGFIIRRRPAKTNEFSVIASYENYGPLVSQGPDGGIYRFLDTNVVPGGWVYRVSEASSTGEESDLCQCLVEVQTEDEQKAALIAAVGIGLVVAVAVLAGLSLDPLQ